MKPQETSSLHNLVHGFCVLKKVGAGTFGQVFKANDTRSNRTVALKVVKYASPKEKVLADHEVRILAFLASQGNAWSVHLEGYFVQNSRLLMVMSFEDYDLGALIQSGQLLSNQAHQLAFQLFKAVESLHQCGILHRDLKSANVLVSASGHLRIGDFGSATVLASEHRFSSRHVTLPYRPPELLLHAPTYDFAVDVWSAGCILVELLSGRPFLHTPNEAAQLELLVSLFGRSIYAPREETIPTLASSQEVSPPSALPAEVCTLLDSDLSPEDSDHCSSSSSSSISSASSTSSSSEGGDGAGLALLREYLARWGHPAVDLAHTLLHFVPSKRPSASAALQHPFFSGAVVGPCVLPPVVGHSWELRQFKRSQAPATNNSIPVRHTVRYSATQTDSLSSSGGIQITPALLRTIRPTEISQPPHDPRDASPRRQVI